MPDYLDEESAWTEHIPFAFWIMEALGPSCFVELGTHTGVSYLAFCQAAQKLGIETRSYAVDTWRGDEHTGFYGEEVFQKLSQIHDPRYGYFSRLVRTTFDEAVQHFDDGSIDLLHIDGLHTYDAVKHDFETWEPKLAPRAVVLLHDTNVRERDFGVFKLWQGLAEAHAHFEFLHGHGLGVLGLGSGFPPAMATLFNASKQPRLASQIRELFARFGAQLSVLPRQAAERDRFSRELSVRDARIEELHDALASRQADAERLSEMLAARDHKVEGLESSLEDRRVRIELLESAVATLRTERARALSIVAARDKQIAELQDTLAAQKADAQRRSKELEKQAAKLRKLKRSFSWRTTAPLRCIGRALRVVGKAPRKAVKAALRLVCLPLRSSLRSNASKHRALMRFTWLLPKSDRRMLADVWLLRDSPLFDKRWYLEQNPDVAKAGNDPVVHYVRSGAKKGRNPSPQFDGNCYLAHNRDVTAAGMNPLVHYVRFGAAEGRSANNASSVGGLPASYSGPKQVADTLRCHFPALQPLQVFFVPGTPRRLTMITDSINKGSLYGGVGTAMILASVLASRLGATLRIVTRNEPPEQANFQKIINLHGVTWKQNIEFRYLNVIDNSEEIDIGEDEIFLTTSWWTTWSVKQAVGPRKVVYLLQEDERMFYPEGDEHVCCTEIIGNKDIMYIINSQLLYEHFVAEGFNNIRTNGSWFEPAFPRSQYYLDSTRNGSKRNFFFYARPRNLRNLYYRGLEVVNSALEQGILTADEWDVYFVGKDLPDDIVLARSVRPKVLQNLEWADYVALVRKIDVGLSLMSSPHPSYPPLDLAASGAVVVTNMYGRKTSLEQYSKNIICVATGVNDLIGGMAYAVEQAKEWPLRKENYINSGLMRDWTLSFDGVLNRLVRN
jgi:hypothetical protein